MGGSVGREQGGILGSGEGATLSLDFSDRGCLVLGGLPLLQDSVEGVARGYPPVYQPRGSAETGHLLFCLQLECEGQ